MRARSVRWLAALCLVACGGSGVAPMAPDAGPATAITATPGSWTWVDFPDSACDDGTPTGIGVNFSATSQNVVVFMMGGGACWDYTTCVTLSTSTHGPYGSTQFAAQFSSSAPSGSIFDRKLAQSPFADWNFVFVPYCTGDVHAGDHVSMYSAGGDSRTFHHVGRANVAAFLRRLAVTFTAPAKFAIIGSSAGGFGALLNFDTFRKAWPTGSAVLVDDSGPVLEGDGIAQPIRDAWFNAWNLAPVADPLCGTTCRTDLSVAFTKLAARYPADRMSLLSSVQDHTSRAYFQLSAPDFQADLLKLATDRLDPASHFHYFFVPGETHTMLGSVPSFSQNGVSLAAFLNKQVTDATWSSEKP